MHSAAAPAESLSITSEGEANAVTMWRATSFLCVWDLELRTAMGEYTVEMNGLSACSLGG